MGQFDGGVPRKTVHPDERAIGVTFRYTSDKRPSGFDIISATVAAESMATGLDTSGSVLESTTAVVTSPDADGTQLVTSLVMGGGSPFNETEHKVTVTSTLDDGSSTKVFVDVFVLNITDRVEEC